MSNGYFETGYVLSTGEAWKGSIGKARITVDLAGVKLYQLVRAFPGATGFKGTASYGITRISSLLQISGYHVRVTRDSRVICVGAALGSILENAPV